jgi:CBS-domain-containing membrane protein
LIDIKCFTGDWLICINAAFARCCIFHHDCTAEVSMMIARDVMVTPVITIKSTSLVQDAAARMLQHHISGLPVVDEDGRIVGMVSEGDLLHRVEAGTERRRSWWLESWTPNTALAAEYVKAHSRKICDVMTRRVITASPDTPLHEVASLLETNRIKRTPVLENNRLVGIVSRANLLEAVASLRPSLDLPESDSALRKRIMARLSNLPWAHSALLNVTVRDGVAELWGITGSEAEHKAIRVAAETTPGVRAVDDHVTRQRIEAWS